MKQKLVRYLCILLSCALLIAGTPTIAFAADYTDVPDSAWYAPAVSYVTQHGLMNGVGNGLFAPGTALNRAQMVVLLHRMEGSPEVTQPLQFQDVAPDSWYAAAVNWASSSEIVKGTGEGTFSPNMIITMEQVATILARYVQAKGVELQTAANPVIGFKDSWYISMFAVDGVELMWQAGIMNGDSQHNFNPRSPVTRADAAAIFMRLDQAMAGETVTVSVPNTTPDHTALTTAQKEAKALVVAQQIASVIPTDLSDLERVTTAARIVSYYCNFCGYTMEGKDYRTPYGVFVKGEFSCAGATRALGLVLECMGYQWTHINENQYSHQWCELYMDGQLGFADGQVGIAGYGPHWAIQ